MDKENVKPTEKDKEILTDDRLKEVSGGNFYKNCSVYTKKQECLLNGCVWINNNCRKV